MAGQLVDLNGALRRLGDDERLLQTIVEFFFEDAPGLMTRIRQAIEARDATAVEMSAHSVRGLASNFGAQQVEAASQRVIELAAASDWPAAKNEVDTLEHEVAQLLDELAPHRAQLAGECRS